MPVTRQRFLAWCALFCSVLLFGLTAYEPGLWVHWLGLAEHQFAIGPGLLPEIDEAALVVVLFVVIGAAVSGALAILGDTSSLHRKPICTRDNAPN